MDNPEGQRLIQKVVELTGLPEEWVLKELDSLIDASGMDREHLTLEDLRTVLLAYLESCSLEQAPMESVERH